MKRMKGIFIFALFISTFILIGIADDNAEVRLPSMCVEGIISDPARPLAIINGETIREGESVKGATVVQISDSWVKLRYMDKAFFKNLGEDCPKKATLDYDGNVWASREEEPRGFSVDVPFQYGKDSKELEGFLQVFFGLGIVFFIISCIISLAIYAYQAIAFQTIARKTGTENGWLAWIPIANMFLWCMIARKSLWWVLLLCIPLINIIAVIILFIEIAKACGKPGWLGALMLLPIPLVYLIILGYLAFSKPTSLIPSVESGADEVTVQEKKGTESV
ncbi:MAG: hypothetical protein JSW40_03190 [Candidatus Omnitrophota bacterium]|nr:MAG: hypothetical protein JSW40_03190 [Candidatus Omnitrophota bacterium]